MEEIPASDDRASPQRERVCDGQEIEYDSGHAMRVSPNYNVMGLQSSASPA
jgi:hypothetical protein